MLVVFNFMLNLYMRLDQPAVVPGSHPKKGQAQKSADTDPLTFLRMPHTEWADL